MKRMLFNATQAEELRVAIVDGQKLIDLNIEYAGKEQRKSNIYKGIVTRIEPSLEAAFVDYGTERHGFLPFKEISRQYLRGEEGESARGRIQNLLKEGQELLVQVDKEERGNKGAALTTYVSLAGRYLVLMPNNPRGGGVSRRVEGDDRTELRETINALEVPQGMSIIGRTAGIGRETEELQWDLNYLMHLWQAIETAYSGQSGPFLIYQEGSLVIRAIRDLFQPEIGEILIDTESIYEQAVQFMAHVMPANVNKVKRYKDDVPLFSRFQIEHQIETAYKRDVALPSGGVIVIDHTEALVSIDVNSARATRGADIEQTAFNTNCEAAEEIARQLRLRDLGGLIVVDFIDMENQRNQREVETRFKEALRHDRARVQLGKISRFGLMELSRQRLQPSLGETSHRPCPRCGGTGHVRDTESSALHVLRIIQEEAMKENSVQVRVQVPVEVATYLLNEKRNDIYSLEARMRVQIVLVPNPHIETPNYFVDRIKQDTLSPAELNAPSYTLAVEPPEEEEAAAPTQEARPARQQAAVQNITPQQPAPVMSEKKEPAKEAKASVFSRIMQWFKSDAEMAAPVAAPERPKPAPARAAQPRADQRPERGRRDRPERNDRKGEQRRERSNEERAALTAAGEGGESPREGGRERNRPNRDRHQKQRRPEQDTRTTTEVGGEATRPAAAPATDGASEERGSRRDRDRGRHRRDRGDRGDRQRQGQREVATDATHGTSGAEDAMPSATPPQTFVAEPMQQPWEAPAERQETRAGDTVAASPPQSETTYAAPPSASNYSTAAPVEASTAEPSQQAGSIQSDVGEMPSRESRQRRHPRRHRPTHQTEAPVSEGAPLMLVETSFPAPPPAEEPQMTNSHRRPRPPRHHRQSVPSEPLVQVETHGDTGQVN